MEPIERFVKTNCGKAIVNLGTGECHLANINTFHVNIQSALRYFRRNNRDQDGYLYFLMDFCRFVFA